MKTKNSYPLWYLTLNVLYPSISKSLFTKAIQFATQITEITDEDTNLIMEARKTILFNEGITWVKKKENDNLGGPMCCFDGAEICELVSSYILSN